MTRRVAKGGGGGGGRDEGGGGGGSAAREGAAAVDDWARRLLAGCVAAGGGPASTMVSTVKGPPGSGVADFFCCRRFPSVETIFSIPWVKPAKRRAFTYLRQNNRIVSTHFFLTFAAGIS